MKINEDKTEFDSKTGTLWHTYGPKTAAKVNLFLKLAKEAGHKIEQHGGMFTIITPNDEDYYTSTIELSRMTNQEIEDYVNDLLEPEDFDESLKMNESHTILHEDNYERNIIFRQYKDINGIFIGYVDEKVASEAVKKLNEVLKFIEENGGEIEGTFKLY